MLAIAEGATENAATVQALLDNLTARGFDREVARLFVVDAIWSKVADPGETFIEAGARRYARDGVAFSYENCLIAEQEGATVGMAHSFDMEEDPDAEPESDPVLKPYSELEDSGSL